MGWLYVQYLVFVFAAACGLLQGVFAYRKIAGLQFFRRACSNYIFAVAIFTGSYAWFFGISDRTLVPVMEGTEQTIGFVAGSAAAVVFIVLVSSLLNRRRLFPARERVIEGKPGLDSLKCATYWGCLPGICDDAWRLLILLRDWKRLVRIPARLR